MLSYSLLPAEQVFLPHFLMTSVVCSSVSKEHEDEKENFVLFVCLYTRQLCHKVLYPAHATLLHQSVYFSLQTSHCILQVSAHREEVVERVVTAGGVKDAGVLAARHGEEALEALQGWGQGRQVGLGWLQWSMG